MKKLLLLLTAGFTISSAIAQENTATMFHPDLQARQLAHPMSKAYDPTTNVHGSNASTRRTTATTYLNSDWFYYWGANYVSGVSGYYFEVYSDSSLYNPADVSATSDGYLFCHGLGMSFDPTDLGYYTSSGVTSGVQVYDSTSYAVDSFFALGQYVRNNPDATVVDSLIVDLIVTDTTAGSGTYLLHYQASTPNSYITSDSTPRVANADYMPVNFSPAQYAGDVWDSINTIKYRYAMPLNSTTPSDTDANGFNETYFGLPTPLAVPAGEKVVSYIHFKSSVAYPLGTNVSSANYYKLFAGDPGGTTIFPSQTPSNATTGYPGSYQTGLISQNQNGYFFSNYGGHNLLFTPFDFIDPTGTTAPSPFGFEVPWFEFHLQYNPPTGIANVNKNITSVKVYPNPSVNVVNIDYSLTTNADVTVSLTNMVGQVVATQKVANSSKGSVQFSTNNLADGVYFYTLNANGAVNNGRIVVAH